MPAVFYASIIGQTLKRPESRHKTAGCNGAALKLNYNDLPLRLGLPLRPLSIQITIGGTNSEEDEEEEEGFMLKLAPQNCRVQFPLTCLAGRAA